MKCAPTVVAGCLFSIAASVPASADENFYAGKTITLVVSSRAGDAYDAVGRLLLRHMTRHIPGKPHSIVQNMPGGSYLTATNFLYNQAPRDGRTIGVVNHGTLMHQVFGTMNVDYDMGKFEWIGSYNSRNGALTVWHTAGVKTIDDLRKKEILLGASTGGSSSYGYALAMNAVLGTKIKLIKGYGGSSDVMLAMQRGEVQARAGGYTTMLLTNADWIRDGKIVFVTQIGIDRDPELPHVPSWIEAAETDEQRAILRLLSSPVAIGYPYLAPPQVPAERLAILRKAFNDTMVDPVFREETRKQQIAETWLTAEKLADVIRTTLSSSPEVISKAKEFRGDD